MIYFSFNEILKKKRAICKTCSSYLHVWGKTSSGKKRYKCPVCGLTRLYRRKSKSQFYFFSLFKQYILWGLTYEMLSSMSGYSTQHLITHFHQFIQEEPPKLPVLDQSDMDEAYLLIDGLWFGRWYVLMVYRQSKSLTILHISVAGREAKTKIARDLKYLLSCGYRFTGLVSDGGAGIVGAIEEVFPHTPHQICLAHMHRRIIACLGRHPKDQRVRELKKLADHIWLIESKEALRWWKDKLLKWIEKNILFLLEIRRDESGRWWYIHKGTRKAARILRSLPKTSFTFLNYPLMPKTTNELEATFGHLAKRWLAHRGLRKDRWENFMKWFVYFYNQEKTSCSKS